MNIQIEQFNSNLQNLLNTSKLPIGVVYYILKYYLKEIENGYYAAINTELLSTSSQSQAIEHEVKTAQQLESQDKEK